MTARKGKNPSELEIFRDFLKHQGMRYTPERETIIREIFSTHEHFDVDSLYLSIRQKGHRISKASIYRLIPLLIQANLIEEVFFEKGQMHYEHIYGHEHHCHLRCKQCSKIEEFSDHRVAQIEQDLEKRFGYKVLRHRLDVIGLCKSCQKKAAESS